MGHHGYIYQATNWIYTGSTKERTDIFTEEGRHSRHYDKDIDKSQNRKKRSSKHRYIYFTGGRKFRKRMISELNYEQKPYPKGQNKRYNASFAPHVQGRLF